MVDSIDTSLYFKDPTTELGSQYDFNKDGTVDIADYNLALVYLNDGDPENDVAFTKDQLESVFAALIEEDEENQNYQYDEITEDNVDKVAKTVTNAICGDNTPAFATTLSELQTIGKNLTKYIKECAEIADIYAQKMTKQKSQLDEIEKEKQEKEEEYATKQSEVEEETTRLENLTYEILQKSEDLADDKQEKSNEIIKSCVTAYINGEYEDQSLQDVICTQLKNANFNVSDLESAISQSKNLGAEINSICSDIDSITAEIRQCTSNYNSKNTEYQSTVKSRNSIVQVAQIASVKYQTGYQKRLDLRQDLIDKYHVTATGSDKNSSSNAQVQSLNNFMNNKELNNMTFSDALAVIEGAFDDCGIKINKDSNGNVSFTIPKGHGETAQNIFAAFAQSLKDNFGVSATLVDDEEEEEDDDDDDDGYEDTTTTGTLTTIARTDPISFTDGDVKYEFIQDRNGDGIFNDKSEFLGSEAGWSEMSLYDTNGDGHISGDELETLQLVGKNQTNGQFTFTTAAEAGISDIDLSSYKENTSEKLKVNGDILDGSFEITMKDGSIKTGEQTYDTNRNLENQFKVVFGSSINETTEEMYDDNNPFMEEFEEKINTEEVVAESGHSINTTESESDDILDNCEIDIKNNVNQSTNDANRKKEKIDEAEAEEAKKEEQKQEEKIAEQKAEETKQAEIAQAKKEENKKKEEQ